MSAAELIVRLRALGVRLWAEGEQLHYDAPAGAVTPELLAEMSERKAQVLEFVRDVESAKDRELPPITQVQTCDRPRPSFAQQRLWFLDRMYGANAAYHIPMAFALRGPLDQRALYDSLNTVMVRHQVLRTDFAEFDGEPYQRIHEALEAELPYEDLTTLAGEAQNERLRDRMQEESMRHFDLSCAPLLRARLFRLAPEHHVLLLVAHHIVADGWSLGVMFRELGTCYERFRSGDPTPLDDLPVHYADFAAWQRRHLSGTYLEHLLDYWKRALAGTPLLDLPTDRPRPPVQSFTGAHLVHPLPQSLCEQLGAFSQRHGATLFMTLLAAYVALLNRYTDQDDITVGSPIANRNRAEVEGLIGFFVNMLVMRNRVDADKSFTELLADVRATALGAFEHQDLPFERLVEELDLGRDASRNPLFQVTFALQNAPTQPFQLSDLALEPVSTGVSNTRFDLEFHVWSQPGGLAVMAAYNSDLFDSATVERMLGHYERLLEAAVAAPDAPLGRLELLTEGERQRLQRWNDTAADYPREATVHALFEAQAARTPDVVAVEFGDEAIDYAELDQRASQLATRLRAMGTGSGEVVGVCLHRSVELVVAILGILKAGAAYLPLDPEYPAPRLKFMLADSSATLVLTQRGLQARLDGCTARQVVLDETDRGADTAPLPRVSATDAAYVLYTSGSTGTPKGVVVPHRALVNHMSWMQRTFSIGSRDAVLQKTPYSFDASVWEFYAPLLFGGRLVLARPDGHRDPRYLVETIKARKITRLQVVPSLLRPLLDEGLGECTSLRSVFCGGEALGAELAAQVLATTKAELVNLYGVTEACIDSAFWQVQRDGDGRTVPIGRPIQNTLLYVLDAHREPVPEGVPGELHIGGDGLATGYLGRPELTAEHFVADPFDPAPGARMFRTGDRVRWHADGALEFLGRRDDQVKLRGYRVELGEVEAALAAHAAVSESVVVCQEDTVDGHMERRLVGYLVADAEAARALSGDAGGWEHEHVSHWRSFYEETYAEAPDAPRVDPTFDIRGWNSSFTGEAIPEAQMREWTEATVARIATLGGSRVLEIGCGTGLLLHRVAPGCERYVGTDFSSVVLDALHERLTGQPAYDGVELLCQEADDFTGLGEGEFDLVVLNSVSQYLPDMDYLQRVLSGAVRVLRAGGKVFVGDVRSLSLRGVYQVAVEHHRSSTDVSARALLQRVRQRLEQENELQVSPSFFAALATSEGRVSVAEALLKRGHAHNELTCFRYDAVLHVEGATPEPSPERARWQEGSSDQEGFTEARLEALLTSSTPYALEVADIPNARVMNDVQRLIALETGEAPRHERRAVEPEDLWALARQCGYQLELREAQSGLLGHMDARLWRETDGERPVWPLAEPKAPAPWPSYGSNPLKGKLVRELVPRLREFVKTRLPTYMVPSAFVVLDALPLNSSGKVDRPALPLPGDARSTLGTTWVAPRNDTEGAIATVWCALLGVERVGVHDDFFELGGHSLLATQVVSRVREALGVELSLVDLFDNATVAGIATLVDESSDRAASHASEQSADGQSAIVRADRNRALPLSFAQERMWVLDRMVPGNPAYNMPFAVRIHGSLDAGTLHRSLEALVARHEALRTTFVSEQGVLRQEIQVESTLELDRESLAGFAAAERDARLQILMAEESTRSFDLARGPLLCVRLVDLSPREHVLLLTIHHAVCDGWSTGVMFRELGALYDAFEAGRPSPLLPLTIQYADFAAWQREWLSGGRLEAQLGYWRKKLEGITPLALTTDRPRPAVQSFAGASEKWLLPPALQADLVALGRREGATLFMTLLTGFTLLMTRYSGQDDIAVGSPIANRNRSEIEDLVGFFVNMLVMRNRVDPRVNFRQMLAEVRETALDAYEHQDLPFEKLVEQLVGNRDLSRNPLFQVSFAVQNAPLAPLTFGGLALELQGAAVKSTRFDLELHLWQQEQGMQIAAIYNTDLFDAATVRRMLGHYQNLLEAVVLDPESPVAELKLLTQTERVQVVESFNATAVDYPREASLGELFAAQARTTPDAVALEFAGATLSYAELDVRANRLAHRLRALGVGHETRVAVCLPRSLELVVTIIATVKAGGAYVPLDPEYPPARLALMLEDSAAAVLLTVEALRERLPPTTATVLCLDNLSLDGEPDNAPPSLAGARSLAYLMYTSGSTGVPKGTCIEHRSVVRLVKSANYLQMEPSQRWLQLAPISFDASTLELWGSLLNGGQLVVFAPHTPTFEELGRCLIEQRIDVLWLTAALFHRMVDEQPEALASVRQLLAGGEALSPPHVERMLARLAPGARLVNGYGPTENTTFTCCHVMRAGDAVHHHVPIGRPISNTTVYVLDERRAPVPVGVPGELYIGGDGLAREYWQRPELTAEKFVPDPFADEAGARLYRTGDRVRWRDDGVLEFLGRLDDQVKLRGFRIEPGEVEAVIAQHPDVRQCVVVCREDSPGEKRIVAYLVPVKDGHDSNEVIIEVRAHARAQLPPYMIPATFVVLGELPVGPAGKIDRTALPAPVGNRGGLPAAPVTPRNELEAQVAAIWCDILQTDEVGIEDNFFDLGGNSLLLLRCHEALCLVAEREIPMVDMFQYPSIRALVEHFGAAVPSAGFVHVDQERTQQRQRALRRARNRRERRKPS